MVVRVGILGCGAIARRAHIPDLIGAGAEVTAFAGRTLSSAEVAARQVGSGHVTDRWQDLLERDDVDAVVICTPNTLHAPMAIAAATAGRHVLVEKPLCTTVADADAIVAAAEQSGVVLMTAHNVRFAPPFAAMREAIAEGRIGAVRSARASLGHAGPQAWAPDATWFRDPASAGGGALTDLGVHLVDTLRWVLDDEFVEVTATMDASPIDHDAHVTFRTEGGAVGALHASWHSPTGDQGMVVHGDLGSLALDPAAGAALLTLPGREPAALPMRIGDNPSAAFVRAIASGGPASPSGHDGRAAVAFLEAAYSAARSGTTTPVERA